RRLHTRCYRDWSSDVCSSDLFHHPRALELAEKLGLAFQLTNILRDVRRDYEIGRVYLPQATLHLYGCRPSDLGQGNLRPALREEIGRPSCRERAEMCVEPRCV